MHPLKRSVFLPLLLVVTACAVLAQTTQKQGTATITGRITLGEKGMANIPVALYPTERMSRDRSSVARATSDSEGRYRLLNVPAGRFNLVAIAPTYVGPSEGQSGEQGRLVTIAEGETIEKMDISLARGGVITGRVTDADGAPVIAERVRLSLTGRQSRGRSFSSFNPFMYQTDDRGIYRIYGIPPGSYTVSVGQSPEDGSVSFGFGGRGYYAQTFYPGVTEEAKATVIEVTEGSEATGVDITLGRKAQTFVATGRVVDESGQPVANVRVGHGTLMQENRMGAYGWGTSSDAKGLFRLDGLSPGRYAAFVWNEGDTESYSEPAIFEIAEGDVSGLELKMRRGATISGVVAIEGTTDRSVLSKLSQFSLGAAYTQLPQGLAVPNFSSGRIAPDGTFHISGLRPGRFRLFLSVYPPPKGFNLARVERDGIAQKEIEVAPGAQVSGLRAVIEYGQGSIRGLVKVENGELPSGLNMMISARHLGADANYAMRGAQVDSRGRFLLEGLPAGEYELLLRVFNMTGKLFRMPPVKQNVTVTAGAEAEVTFTIDLNANPEGGGNND